MIKYITFSFAISVISWIVGMVVNAGLIKTPFYKQYLTKLNFITDENLNRYIGIGIFKWIIIHSLFKYFNPKLSLKKKIIISELPDLRNEMTIAEISHLIGFVFVMGFVLVKVGQGYYLFALVMLIVNILMNLYPTLLQQQNKRRIDKYRKILTVRGQLNN
ncbi:MULTISPECIES: hypothetical protein [unclassified Pedobacter]|uniref:glycosyl-4,4'-diaponeurosporenoate acyltransferase CrtO family protein n=1 Tax=unclassified Pedobacter TaxID=2628915 RepID=UPI001E149604|nr:MULTISPECIES: hypothetical protein [unclassified Pedobacter]CAH0158409.1 hypothetical protein SRABI36_00973 [Pedobacter sp. Bi36]CAH0214754.1 hypothetical protein SRABI126_02064 [Pedobacter sp. Bi126]